MRSFVKSRRFLLVLGLSGMFVVGMWLKIEYYDWYSVAIPRIVKCIISMIELPAFVVSAIIGGNPDYPFFVVYYPLLFLTSVFIFSGLIGLFRLVSKQVHSRRFLEKKE